MANPDKGNFGFELKVLCALCTITVLAAAAAKIYYKATHHISKALPHAMKALPHASDMAATSGYVGNPAIDIISIIIFLVMLFGVISAVAGSSHYNSDSIPTKSLAIAAALSSPVERYHGGDGRTPGSEHNNHSRTTRLQ